MSDRRFFSEIPFIVDVETLNITSNDDMLLENTELNPLAEPFILLLAKYTFNDILEQPQVEMYPLLMI